MKKQIVFSLLVSMFGVLASTANLAPPFPFDKAQDGKFPGWYGQTAAVRVVNDVPPGVPGGKSICLDFSDKPRTGGSWGISSRRFKIDPAKSYRLSVWTKTEGKKKGFGSTFGYFFYNEKQKTIAGSDYKYAPTMRTLFYVQGPKDWQYYSLDLFPAKESKKKYLHGEIPPDARYISLSFGAYNYKGKIWFTQPILEELRLGDSKPQPGDEKMVEAGNKTPKNDFMTTVCPFEEVRQVDDAASFTTALEGGDFVVRAQSRQPAETITMTAKHNGDPSVWHDDSFDFAFDPSGTRSGKFFQVTVTPGNISKAIWKGRSYPYNDYRTSARRTAEGWEMEVRFPMTRIIQLCGESGLAVSKSHWDFSIGRNWPKGKSKKFLAWNYSAKSFHTKSCFGRILFRPRLEVLRNIYAEGLKKLAEIEKDHGPFLKRQFDAPQIERERQIAVKAIADYRADAAEIGQMKDLSEADFARLTRRSINLLSELEKLGQFLGRAALGIPDAWKPYGITIWRCPLLTLPKNNEVPDEAKISDRFAFRGPMDSFASLQFAMFPYSDLEDLTCTVSDFKTDDGMTIPASDCRLSLLTNWNNRGFIFTTDSRIPIEQAGGDYPDKPVFQEKLPAFDARHFYLKVKTGGTPGVYRGKIFVQSKNRPVKELSVSLEVLPFRLDGPGKTYGFFYLGVLDKNVNKKSPAYAGGLTPESMKREMTKLYADGCRILTLYCYATGPLNPKYAREVMGMARQAGFEEAIILGAEHLFTSSYKNDPEKKAFHLKKLKEKLLGVKRIGEELGFRKLYIYAVDEALSPSALERLTAFCDAVHETGLETTCGLIFEQARKIAGSRLDLVMMNWRVLSNEGAKSAFNEAVRSGSETDHKRAFYYPILGNTPPLDRMVFGWYLYKSNYEGCCPWSWYEFQQAKKPNLKMIRYVVQTPGGILHTLRYEGALEGIQDMRYIRTLEKTPAGRAVLAELKNSFPLDNNTGALDAIPPEKYEEMRGRMIEVLRKAR
ncbi:MAG: hypothetical protein IJS14_08685 [Lentisphaeria bacterium]|nr:hypothetical protein [Lentisphaeria bacterium]